MVRETVRRFLEKESPISAVRKAFDDTAGFSRDWWRRASELGWTSLGLSEENGGYPVSLAYGADLSIVAEEMGRLVAPGPFLPTAVALSALANSDNADLIASVVAGDSLIAWAFGEPGDIWARSQFRTEISVLGDEVVVRGCKAYVEAGAQAEHVVVSSSDSQVLVPINAAGVTVIPGRSVDFTRRFASLKMDDVRLPKSALIGDIHGAATEIERQLQLALGLQCAEMNGALDQAMAFTIEYMRERYAFGRPIASYQALKHRLADMLLKLQSCMATTDSALDAYDARSGQATRLAHVAKAYVGFRATEICGELVQMTGGIAVTWDHDMHLYERRVAVNRAVFGGPERHRDAVIGLLRADRPVAA